MKTELIYTRKIKGQGSVKLKARKLKNNPARLFLEIYRQETQKRNLEFINLLLIENDEKDKRTIEEGIRRCNAFVMNENPVPKLAIASNFTSFFKKQIETIEKKRSKGIYNSTLAKLQEYSGCENIPFKRIDESFLKGYRSWLLNKATRKRDGEPLTDYSRKNYFEITMTFANKAKGKGLINPYAYTVSDISTIEVSRKPVNALTVDDILKLQATPYPPMPNLPKAFMLQFSTLQRWSDIRNMTWETLNNLFIEQVKTGTNVPMLYDEKLLTWIAGEDKRIGRIFTGFPMDDQTIREHLREWTKLAGVNRLDLGTHDFRRAGATIMYEHTKDIYKVSYMLGHKSIEQTKVYIGITESIIREGFDALNKAVISKFRYTQKVS